MVIDVIAFTDEQFATLSEEQILEVKSVQLKVNKLRQEADRLAVKMKFTLLKNGVGRSSALEEYEIRERERIEQEIDTLREGLLFYLRFTVKHGSTENEAPYTVDYSLTYQQRYLIVKAYYDGQYTDARERYNALREDEIAKVYLGEMYLDLSDLYKFQAGV